jgi:DNA helicase II / ATP-dependent DNA helicase PcrA
MEPTAEQHNILNLLKETHANLLIRALAGAGKTSTLGLIESAARGPILCLAFNKKIAEEMSTRFSSTTSVRTFNSLGHRIWAKANAANLKLDPKKTQNQFKEHIKGWKKDAQREAWKVYWEVVHGVGLAKSLGYIPEEVYPNAKRLIHRGFFHNSLDEEPSALTSELIDDLLAISIRSAYNGLIDYNDQIYMPALFGGTFPKFPLVLVDEAQDLSPVNHEMLKKLGRDRVIAVGDSFQSIYGFRGAVQNGMQHLSDSFSMIPADLSVSFRCPQAIVEAARWRVPHYKWIKEGGHVSHLKELDHSEISEEATAIICRNNAPLFSLAFSLLSHGRSVSVAGSDIGPKLTGILKRLGDENMPRSAVLREINSWQAAREAKGNRSAKDLGDCMRVFATHGETLSTAISYAEHLFAQKGNIRLMTGHKAKGLEFDTVYHLDPWLIGEEEQELNLRYVIGTRSKDKLFYINSGDIKWN